MKTICAVTTAVAVLLFVRQLAAGSGGTQGYEPSRFALMEASANVSYVANSGGMNQNVQKIVLKLDTRTGQVWVLQLAVNGSGDPTVCGAVWAKVEDRGRFGHNAPPELN